VSGPRNFSRSLREKIASCDRAEKKTERANLDVRFSDLSFIKFPARDERDKACSVRAKDAIAVASSRARAKRCHDIYTHILRI